MIIKKIPYKASGTRKYNIMHNGKEYTCYLNPHNGNSVVTGNGKNSACKDISDTILGIEIMLACHTYKEDCTHDDKRF